MVCLDTNIIIDFLKKKVYAINRLKELNDENISLSTTSVNTFELYGGVIKSGYQDSIHPLNALLNNIKIINLDLNSSKKAAEIFEDLKSKGEIIDLADIMIASIAITNKESLLTENKNHFKRIKELILEE